MTKKTSRRPGSADCRTAEQSLVLPIPTSGSGTGPSHDLVLNLRAVQELVPVSRATIMRWERAGRFPRRVRLSQRSVGWLESEINAFVSSRPRGLAL